MIAIDLGSNTIRFLAGDRDNLEIWSAQFVVGTARGLKDSGEISAAALERIINAVHIAKNDFDFSRHKISAVATEAFRQAKNRYAAIDLLREETGIEFEVISSEMEAELTALAASKSAKNIGLKTPYIILDIGGASSETIYVNCVDRGDRHDRSDRPDRAGFGDFISQSLPIGIVTIGDMKMPAEELKLFMENELKKLDSFKRGIANMSKARTFIATSGAPTTLAAIKMNIKYADYDKKLINGSRLNTREIIEIYEKLTLMGENKRDILTGRSRGDLVLTGAVMLIKFMEFFGFEEMSAIDEGLREGILLQSLETA